MAIYLPAPRGWARSHRTSRLSSRSFRGVRLQSKGCCRLHCWLRSEPRTQKMSLPLPTLRSSSPCASWAAPPVGGLCGKCHWLSPHRTYMPQGCRRHCATLSRSASLLFLVHATGRRCSVVLGNLDDDDFVLLRRCLPDPMWSVLPHVVMEARIACKQQVRGIRWRRQVPGECKQELSRVGRSVVFQTRNV